MLNGIKIQKRAELFHQKLMTIGASLGCHQLPERSFSINEFQFPICARCTGVLIGNIIGICGVYNSTLKWNTLVLGCGIMYLDWHLQFLRLIDSSNARRFFTGIIGGYSLTSIYINAIFYLINLVKLILVKV